MAANEYCFLTQWRVRGSLVQVYDLITDAQSYLRWWPQVYLEVEPVIPPGKHGLGASFNLHTRGRLPYTLRWTARIIDTRFPNGLTITATGDFVGRGIWSFEQEDASVRISFDWRLRAEKPLLKHLSFLLKPLFSANHRWAMARGEEGLQNELARSNTR